MTIILDMRAEKERLQQRIEGMQSTIDNIQKELTGRPAPGAAREPPEHDAPRRDDATLYSFLSDADASLDADALDAREVGRRFDALAQAVGRGGPQRRQALTYYSGPRDTYSMVTDGWPERHCDDLVLQRARSKRILVLIPAGNARSDDSDTTDNEEDNTSLPVYGIQHDSYSSSSTPSLDSDKM
ncbi:hypothetical protein B5X24_HaOG215768 [Helicoverpa armigera]|uniref:Uncharacterized protein n=1 Tax=Helicoverpa armigera TaxID=29058 RepID=A0A2W1B6T6_HELAM|nr:hypothetical protein B5X24_HaOG215768 [Helicoverpa armigera]